MKRHSHDMYIFITKVSNDYVTICSPLTLLTFTSFNITQYVSLSLFLNVFTASKGTHFVVVFQCIR